MSMPVGDELMWEELPTVGDAIPWLGSWALRVERGSWAAAASFHLCFLMVAALWAAASCSHHLTSLKQQMYLEWPVKISPSSQTASVEVLVTATGEETKPALADNWDLSYLIYSFSIQRVKNILSNFSNHEGFRWRSEEQDAKETSARALLSIQAWAMKQNFQR